GADGPHPRSPQRLGLRPGRPDRLDAGAAQPSAAVPVGKGRREEMDLNNIWPVWSYLVYVSISVALTMWVARTLHKNGRIFLVDAFHGNEALADSVNHLLVVGFYLINIGYVTLALKSAQKPDDMETAIELLSTKIGLV